MTSEPAISQQVPSYFLQEASELLQQMDRELQTLRQDFSVQKMHGLMRTAHTLKGAAASVGLEAIKTTTHSLEDAFKALCVPDATLTVAVEGLIFEAYDCLQLLVSAQTSAVSIDESSILDRMANVVTQLQQNLGDQFGQDGYLPTSTELGFDMTQSIFEMGVTQRLNDLETALTDPQPNALGELLRSQADVFFGLAESLSLPGFGEIARATVTALKHHPDQVIEIATIALADYRAGQTKILQGDRTQGGAPSPALKTFGQLPNQPNQRLSGKPKNLAQKSNWLYRGWQRLNSPLNLFSHRSKPSSKASSQPETALSPTVNSSLPAGPLEAPAQESIWENAAAIALAEPTATKPSGVAALGMELTTNISSTESASTENASTKRATLESASTEGTVDTVDATENAPLRDVTLRVALSHFEQLNYTIGELLTQHNRQSLYNERLTAAMKTLLLHMQQQQQQFRDLQRQTMQMTTNGTCVLSSSQGPLFDTLELDHYNDIQLKIQASLETMGQQMESADAIELFVRQSSQTLKKQQQLVDDLRATVLEARMQPLGSLFKRFDQVLSRLSVQHQKPVTLTVHGEDVLVDKAIADKLYDPLLHLVRNAFDHGIEHPDVRQQQGKIKAAKIQLTARQLGRYLIIQIQDNGQGLNLDLICQKAVENHLVSAIEAQNLTPAQISNFIFEPDLSTAPHVNDLSGRGVGLDVVQTQINALRGTVSVASHSRRGTCFTLKIPANLSIAKLLLCQAGERLYALMTDTIEQILIPSAGQLTIRNHRKILSCKIEGQPRLIPVIPLSETLTYNGSSPQIYKQSIKTTPNVCPIILMRSQKRLVGLEIDQLLGEQELVIRSLGDMTPISVPNYIYGCSPLPDGRLSLVVDGAALALKLLNEPSGNRTINIINRPSVQATSPNPPTISKQSILVMDDSITARNTLTQTLQKAGYLVIQAKDGAEGLHKLHRTHVDAILCDLEMPGMNGFEFLKARQQNPQIAPIPTVMLTSRTGMKYQKLAHELGATGYLTKPYISPHLLESLDTILAKSRSSNSPIESQV
ncbi:MAG: hybrid sensor histidine kinase/response regulator [Cyanobacteria bacterium P01_C01_bin.118]